MRVDNTEFTNEIRDKLIGLYQTEHLSDREIGRQLGMTRDSVRNARLRFGILSRSRNENRPKRYANLSDTEKSVIDGMLLGDWNLNPNSLDKRAKSYTKISAILSTSMRGDRRDILESMNKHLPSIQGTLSFSPPRDEIIMGRQTTRRYGSIKFQSKSYADLLDVYNRWYNETLPPRKRKIVPNDLKLNKSVIYWWYIGDGCGHKKETEWKNPRVGFATDGFRKHEVEFLRDLLLKETHIPFKVTRYRSYYRLTISTSTYVKNFFDYLGLCLPEHQSLRHRWPPDWYTYPSSSRGRRLKTRIVTTYLYTFSAGMHLLDIACNEHMCCNCGVLKPFVQFHRAKTRKLGIRSVCKECRYAPPQ